MCHRSRVWGKLFPSLISGKLTAQLHDCREYLPQLCFRTDIELQASSNRHHLYTHNTTGVEMASQNLIDTPD
jgi:hypothetical protein